MNYYSVRLIFWFGLFFLPAFIWYTKKVFKTPKRFVILLGVAFCLFILLVTSMRFQIENYTISFSSPQSVINYGSGKTR